MTFMDPEERKAVGQVTLSASPSRMGAERTRRDVESWHAYAVWRLGQIYPDVLVATSSSMTIDVVDAPTSAWRAELRERLNDAWDDWCGGARTPEWTIRELLDTAARTGGDRAIAAIAEHGYDVPIADPAFETLREGYGSLAAALAAIQKAARERLA